MIEDEPHTLDVVRVVHGEQVPARALIQAGEVRNAQDVLSGDLHRYLRVVWVPRRTIATPPDIEGVDLASRADGLPALSQEGRSRIDSWSVSPRQHPGSRYGETPAMGLSRAAVRSQA